MAVSHKQYNKSLPMTSLWAVSFNVTQPTIEARNGDKMGGTK
jgi:hypothetical protein